MSNYILQIPIACDHLYMPRFLCPQTLTSVPLVPTCAINTPHARTQRAGTAVNAKRASLATALNATKVPATHDTTGYPPCFLTRMSGFIHHLNRCIGDVVVTLNIFTISEHVIKSMSTSCEIALK